MNRKGWFNDMNQSLDSAELSIKFSPIENEIMVFTSLHTHMYIPTYVNKYINSIIFPQVTL